MTTPARTRRVNVHHKGIQSVRIHACIFISMIVTSVFGADLPSRDLAGLPHAGVEREIQGAGAESWWVRVADTLYSPSFAPQGEGVDSNISHYGYYIGHKLPAEMTGRRVGGGSEFHLLHYPEGVPDSHDRHDCLSHGLGGPHPVHAGLEWDVAYRPDPAQPASTRDASDAQIHHLLSLLDEDRYLATVTTLADFGTRRTGTQGNVDARDWIAAEFASAGLVVTTPEFFVTGTPTRNVVGTKIGWLYPDEFIVVGGHFDSIGTGSLAPGAEDNASGTAGVLEIARVLGPLSSERTIHFIAFSGEEQGLYGSGNWVSRLTTAERAKCKGALIMDMIAYTGDLDHDVWLSGGGFLLELRNQLAAAGAQYTSLRISVTTGISGSDHTPFLNANMPAVLSIAGDYSSYPGYHNSGDIVANVNKELGIAVTSMNLALAAQLAVGTVTSSSAADAWLLAE
jgi:hypothetical protein